MAISILRSIILLTFLSILLLNGNIASSEEFSGEWVRTFQDQIRIYKVYHSKEMWRIEGKRPAEKGELKDFIWIYRFDKGVVWEPIAEFKWYNEVPIDDWFYLKALGAREGLLLGWLLKGCVRKELGEETIDSHLTKKYEVVCPWGMKGKGKIRYFQWVATDLGVPLKVISSDGSWVNELKNIKTGKQNPEFFKMPLGYINVKNLYK